MTVSISQQPSRERPDFDAVVVGLGALGSAAAWQLARRGLSVLGLDARALGHRCGASHGDSRIIRLSYHTPSYVRSAAVAYAAWAQLEAESGQRLITGGGGVDVFPTSARGDVVEYTSSLAAAGVQYQLLDVGAAAARWPGLVVPAGSVVLQQDRTGIVAADLALAVLHRQARAHGALLREGCAVTAVHETGSGVTVITADGERLRAGRVVLACDGWTNDLLDVPISLLSTQEYVRHFAVPPGSHLPGAFPVWIWMGEPSFYGFPSLGEDSIKIGQDCGGLPIHPDSPLATGEGVQDSDDQAYLARLTDFVRTAIPGAGAVIRTTRCIYTVTPDRDFVLGPAPGHERVLVALGAAHGFKFAAWFGIALADLVQHGQTPLDIAPFAADRPSLHP